MRGEKLVVGSIVRAKRGSKRCRAMVATVGGDDGDRDCTRTRTVCILWEPIYPHPLYGRFLIVPKSIRREIEQDEVTVDVETVEELFPFENNEPTTDTATATATARSGSDNEASATATSSSIALWKERGDQLLRLGDASAATSYYEKALSDSSSVSIGGSIIISVEGFPRIAEVDCVDDGNDDGNGGSTIDVTLVHSEEERTVKETAILLSIMQKDTDNLQERILLNLARCMLQLSELDAANRPKYLKAAVLATTLVLTLSSFREEQKQIPRDDSAVVLPANSETALVLRCKAYSSLSKWKNALSDARQLVKSGINQEQGKKLLAGVERKKKMQSKTDKKLAKQICRLVESATAANEISAEITPRY
uniref:Uncharacterized protein n=1 Tax=Pseudo-nitzschia australis TaxID=44445 RepID=A0A7S4ALA8_9STRA|mmetsp:Transcript_24056/g.52710  ORF Transcript_24056/g.52710 Transcript_24056/m.52710 type:complete len:366 (-) Transcript_24056:665-1762(-)